MTDEPSNSTVLRPPAWLSKREKSEFARIVSARNAVGNPIGEIEIGAVSDLVACRARIAALQKVMAAILKEAREEDRVADQRDLVALVAQIDRSTVLARQIAADLKLGPTER